MKRVKQISLDILVDEDTNGDQLAEEIKEFLEVNNYDILGAAFTEDMTKGNMDWRFDYES